MVQSSVADIIGPSVTAECPDALAHQKISQAVKLADRFVFFVFASRILQDAFQLGNPLALLKYPGFIGLIGIQERIFQLVRYRTVHFPEQALRLFGLLVNGQAETETELRMSSNSELDHAGPSPSALVVYGVVGRFPP